MTAVLVVAGAVLAFLVGWFLGHRTAPDHLQPAPAHKVTSGVDVADVLAGHPTGVVVADALGRIQYRNRAAQRLAGTHAGVLLDAAIERHLETARSRSASDEVVEFYGPPKMVFDVTARSLDGRGSVVFVEDISERRRIDQVRTDFVANISHELKTPIGAMSVLAETLVDEREPDTVLRIVNRMLAEADRAARTIEDLMELSRIEAGGEVVVEDVRVSEVIRGALDRVTELAGQRNISISTLEPVDGDAQRSDRLYVRGDRRQLVSALGNLVENAVKYSDAGTSVQVRAKVSAAWVEIAVSDQGPGIPKRDVDRIFERFYRVDRARSRTTGGTGLGLSIVRHVASNHRGEVVVTSTEGEGSTFVLRLPTREAAAALQPVGDDELPSAPDGNHDRNHDQGVA
jgi:two-component system, OmpR family, sensor histidine kinase SenX3